MLSEASSSNLTFVYVLQSAFLNSFADNVEARFARYMMDASP